MGGAQPVARVPFYLLDDDLETILQKAGVASDNTALVFQYGLTMRYEERHKEAAVRMRAAISGSESTA